MLSNNIPRAAGTVDFKRNFYNWGEDRGKKCLLLKWVGLIDRESEIWTIEKEFRTFRRILHGPADFLLRMVFP